MLRLPVGVTCCSNPNGVAKGYFVASHVQQVLRNLTRKRKTFLVKINLPHNSLLS